MIRTGIITFVCSIAAMLAIGCGGAPSSQDVIGAWVSDDGARIVIHENGSFMADALPQDIFFRPGTIGPPLSGSGYWEVKRKGPYSEISLSFREIGNAAGRYATSVLIAGKGDATYLYAWKGEEGEARYRFNRKQ